MDILKDGTKKEVLVNSKISITLPKVMDEEAFYYVDSNIGQADAPFKIK